MKKNMVINIFVILIVLAPIIFSIIREKKNKEKLYENQINSKVMSHSDWQTNSREYYLRNGLYISLNINDTAEIKIGDSISKRSNTYEYQIYRRNGLQRYELYKQKIIRND